MPTTIAPALRSRATTGWSRGSGPRVQAGDPSVQTSPATATLSFTAMGTPASGAGRVRRRVDRVRLGERHVPPDHAERADPASTASMWARWARTTSTAVTSPDRTSRAISVGSPTVPAAT